jgi:polyhydroxyalkanoate synthesis regulator protein
MMNLQNPLMQGLMGNYLDQSKELFINMQEQMKSSQNLFGGFPFAPSAKPTDKE